MSLIFRQKRVGKYWEEFTVYKIQTMVDGAESMIGPKDLICGKMKNDPRVTKNGRKLRKFFIDEFPQFFNVLKGEMKIVGYRPQPSHYYDKFPQDMQCSRFYHRPGILPIPYAFHDFNKEGPISLEKYIEVERKYWKEKEKRPILTDIKYGAKILCNIVFKGYRGL